jgi:hypothetical protein
MKYTAILLFSLILTSCSEDQGPKLTTDDLAISEGKSFYLLHITGADDSKYLGLRVNGRESNNGGTNGFKNGEIVKALIWEQDGQLHYSLIADGSRVSRASKTGFDSSYDATTHLAPYGSQIEIGQVFMKRTSNSNKDGYEICFNWSSDK